MTQEVKILLGIGALTLVLLFSAVFFLSNSSSNSASNPNIDTKLLIKPDSNKHLSETAQLTFIEFGDYQCPACGTAHPIVNQVLKNYPDKVNFVFRHFPLPQHQNAILAAEAAEAAGEQGKYWQMHDLLYENQAAWSESNDASTLFSSYAQSLNLNLDQFKSNLTSKKYLDKINADKNDGISLGVNSTPTFYFLTKDNQAGKLASFNYTEFKKVIEQYTK